MATFAELEATNPDIRRQFREWVDLREQTGGDLTDYQAFRQHVIFRGAPDPGEHPPADFLTPDGAPGGASLERPLGQTRATVRPEEADASLMTPPLSDAEAAQLGPSGELAAPPAGRDVAGRNEPTGGAPRATGSPTEHGA